MAQVAKDMLLARLVSGGDFFSGNQFEQSFAKGIHALWKPSNLGLDDVVLGNTCWGAKTVKSSRPFSQPVVRLISGRNSLDYSFSESDVRSLSPDKVGELVLSIWNARVGQVRSRFNHVRTAVLMKGPGLSSGSLFEIETFIYDYTRYRWLWNSRRNLEAFNESGEKSFVWQPHGSQFTIVERVPENRFSFQISLPDDLHFDTGRILDEIGFDDTWIKHL